MWRLLIVVALVPPLVAVVLRWWYGTRVLESRGGRMCRADLGRWLPGVDEGGGVRRSDERADAVGYRLWRHALGEWEVRDAKRARARRNAVGMAGVMVPFAVVVVVFAVVVGKVHAAWGIALVVASLAMAAATAYLTLGAELREVARAARVLKEAGTYRIRDDEEAVVECAFAHAWREAMPLVLRWLQGELKRKG